MSYQTLNFEIRNKIGFLTIQRPEALNALNTKVIDELSTLLTELNFISFSELQVLVLTGAGEKAFVAGADIKEINSLTPQSAKEFAEKGQKVFRMLEFLKIPSIAAVNGFALGGGLELALSCDFIYASEKARFGLPEVSLGLIPGFGGTVRLSRNVGLQKAREIIFSGDMLNAQEALQCGLVAKVFPPEELKFAVEKVATSIANRGPAAVAMAKKSILNSYDLDLDAAMGFEASLFGDLFSTSDVKEGTLAFIEKRKADFKGK